MLQWSSHSQNLFCQIFGQEFEAEMKLSGLSWRSCEGSKRVISPLQAGRSTRYPATIETPGYERNLLLLDEVHSTNLERFTWLFIFGTNWLFCGTNWLLKVTLFVWKSIRKKTPLSSEIHFYVESRKGLHLNRYRSNSNSVRFLLKGQLQN